MTPLEKMTDEQFKRHALEILHRELGVYGLARFLRVSQAGTGDYTQDRGQWLQGVTVQDLVQECEQKILADAPEAAFGKEPSHSLRGLLAKYGPAPSAKEIDENRAEMFANFPRTDF
jgi:hypothetical protein